MLYPLQNPSISIIFSYKTYRTGFSMSVSLTSTKKKKKSTEEKGLGIEIHKLIENLVEDI